MQGVSVIAYCPGWVRTDMAGQQAALSIDEGAATPIWIVELSQEETRALNGEFCEKSAKSSID